MAKLEYEYVYEDSSGNPIPPPEEQIRKGDYEEDIVDIVEVPDDSDGTPAHEPGPAEEQTEERPTTGSATPRGAVKPAVVVVGLLTIALVIGAVIWRRDQGDPKPVGTFSPSPGTPTPAERSDDKDKIASRIADLGRASPLEVHSLVENLAKHTGEERKLLWRAAIGGLAGPPRTRIRAARLATALAAKPGGKTLGPVDPDVLPPLLECLGAEDLELVRHALRALGAINLSAPDLQVSALAKQEVNRLLDSQEPERSRAAVDAVPMFKDTSLAGKVMDAWLRHHDDGIETQALSALKIMATQRLMEAEKRTHPEKANAECWRSAHRKLKEIVGQLGNDPAKWRKWWRDRTAGRAAH